MPTATEDYPIEVAPGNVMRLKEPYHSGLGLTRRAWTHGIVAQVLHSGVGAAANPHWRLALFLYDPASGAILVHEPSGLPTKVDFGADEMFLVKIGRHTGYWTLDHDLYPKCRECREGWVCVRSDTNNDAVQQRCPVCRGFGAKFAPLPDVPHPESLS